MIALQKLQNAKTKAIIAWQQYKRRRKLNARDFTIISNNCWAGTAVYQPFGLKYNTPTVGLFFMDDDYIRFLERFDWYVKLKPKLIEPQNSRYYNKISKNGSTSVSYPIATLGDDIEIHFLHYQSPQEAIIKWQRRAARINYNKLLIKASLRDTTRDGANDFVRRFDALPYRNKICFVPYGDCVECESCVYVPELSDLDLVGGDETNATQSHIDIFSVLNSIK